MGNVIKPYNGYFSVTIPENLKKLVDGNILKLRDAVTEFSEFLVEYGETASEVEEGFYDYDDITDWIYYHSLSFAFPDNKIMVGIKSANEKMFRNIQQGIVDGKFKIYLRGTAKVSKDEIEGVSNNLIKVTIKKIQSYWEGKLHSSSPDVDLIIHIDKTTESTNIININDLPTKMTPRKEDVFVIDDVEDSTNITWASADFSEMQLKNLYDEIYKYQIKKFVSTEGLIYVVRK